MAPTVTLSTQDLGISRYDDKSPQDSTISASESSVKDNAEAGKPTRARSVLRTFRRYIWDDPNKPKEERRFLLKLDFFLLTYACLGYFCKNLDQANINNAYVSGMKETLHMGGSQLTYLSNVFTAGYVVSQIPVVILVSRVRPSVIIPSLEVLWSIFTFCEAAVTTVPHLYALRFLIGFCEGAFFPCMTYVIGSWYKKEERAKRVTLFYCTASLAAMFSGYLQAAVYKNLSGHLGHSGWQWLFIVCGIISLPVGVLGYFFCPDFPENTRAFYFSPEQAVFARSRLETANYKPLGASAWNRTKIFRIMKHWQFWILPAGYFFIQASLPSQQPNFALYLKSKHESVHNINVLPTGQNGLAAVVQIVAGILSDSPLLKGKRWQAITLMQAGSLFGVIVLAVWTVPEKLKYAAYYLSYTCAGVPGLWYSWYPDLISQDHEMRGFLIALSNICGYVNQIWYSSAFWRTALGPKFRSGWIAAGCFGVMVILTSVVASVLEKVDARKRGETLLRDSETEIERTDIVASKE